MDQTGVKTIKLLENKGKDSWQWIWQGFLGCGIKTKGNRRKNR